MIRGAPLVIKLLQGTKGIGVVLAETQKAVESVIEGFMGVKADILVQEYIRRQAVQTSVVSLLVVKWLPQ